MKKSISAVFLICLLLPAVIHAETIVLRSGKSIEGTLLEKTADSVKLDIGGAVLTYYLDDIETIDGKKVAAAPQQDKKKTNLIIEIVNPEYSKAPDKNQNVLITDTSSIEDMLKKINYYYATHEFDKAIELGELALTKTEDKALRAQLYFGLSSNYLEKGIGPFAENNDDSYYKKSIEYAKKSLEVIPDSWQILGNLGAVHLNMRDWKQAIYYYREALKYLSKDSPRYESMVTELLMAEEMLKRESATKP